MFKQRVKKISVAIANGASVSSAVDIRGFTSGVIIIPSAITASLLRFQVSSDGTTFTDVDVSGTVIAKTLAASAHITIPTEVFGALYMKVATYITTTPTVQAAARVLTFVLKG